MKRRQPPAQPPPPSFLRALLVTCGAFLGLACAPPPVVPLERPHWIAVDVEPSTWSIGWSVPMREFSETLTTELARYDVHVVERGKPAELSALVDLGLWNNWRAIDVAITRAGRTVHVGRVMVPDQSMPTLDVAAGLVASIIARGVVTTTPSTDPAVVVQ